MQSVTSNAVNGALTNYTKKERYVIEPNVTRNFTIKFGSWGNNIVIIYVHDPWRCTMHSCALAGYIQDLINPVPILELSKSPEDNIVTVHNGNSYAVAICFEYK